MIFSLTSFNVSSEVRFGFQEKTTSSFCVLGRMLTTRWSKRWPAASPWEKRMFAPGLNFNKLEAMLSPRRKKSGSVSFNSSK